MLADGLIVEGIVTTTNDDGTINIAPMGPIVDAEFTRFVLRPFQTSTTYRNLKRTGGAVFHVTDDVLLLAQAAIGQLDPRPRLIPCPAGDVPMLADACRWHAVRVESLDDRSERVTIEAEVVGSGVIRDFFGFNRAKHAVVEAAILATRVHILPAEEIEAQFAQLAIWVDKTGGPREHAAFQLLDDYVRAAAHQ